MNSDLLTENSTATVTDRPVVTDEATGEALRVLDLVKTYRAGFWRRACPALGGISFTVTRGEVFALLGHNGAGKTTTMKCILDLVHPDHGTIEIFGADHRDWQRRSRIGYLPEGPYFYEHLSGRELLDFYGHLFNLPQPDRRRRIAEVLDQVGMVEHAAKKLCQYSKGMLQRIGLAQAILNEPEVLILDEPMSGLDPQGRQEIRRLLLDLKRAGTTILLSTHIVPDVEALADRVGILKQGRLHAIQDLSRGSPATHFEVTLGQMPHGAIADVVRGCRCLPAGPRHPGAIIEVPDLDRLARLLTWCSDLGAEVQAVRTPQASLEEVFLQALDAGSGREASKSC